MTTTTAHHALAAAAAAALALSCVAACASTAPPPVATASATRAAPHEAIVTTLEVADGELRLEVSGAGGEALVVLGEAGVSHELYAGLARYARSDLRVVVFAAPWRERVARGVDPLAATLDDLEAIRAGLGGEPLHVLGHGHGALVALEYVLAHPESVASLLLVDPEGPGAEARAARRAARDIRRARLVHTGVLTPSSVADCAARFRADLPLLLGDAGAEVAPATWPTCDDAVALALRTALLAAEGDEPQLRLSGLLVPTLVTWGERSPGAAQAARVLRGALGAAVLRAAELEGCGALPWLECPERFAPVIDVFLTLQTARTGLRDAAD